MLGQRGPIRAPDQSLLLHGFMQVCDGAGCSCISGCNRERSRKHQWPVPIAVKRLRDSKGDQAFTVVFMTPFSPADFQAG